MVKLAFFNNKGGVGKSTATINVARVMAKLNKKRISNSITISGHWKKCPLFV